MIIRDIPTESAWHGFILAQKPNTFLQSWQWGQVQIKDGEAVRYLGAFEGNTQIAAALVITVHARRGIFYLIPHGPITTPGVNISAVIQGITDELKKTAVADKAVAIRIAPLIEQSPENEHIFQDLGFRSAPLHIHAELTWILDISGSEEQILAGMRKTSRHAVKKATAAGAQVEILTGPEAINRFWPLYEATHDRHNFVPFSKEFIASQLEEFDRGGQVYVPIASYQGQDVAAAVMIQFGSTIFYYHGASIKVPDNVPAAHLLHWESIKQAKKRGATQYNFWGIAPDNQPNHPFAGITVFKKGFGGQAIEYMHAQDLPLSLGYWKLYLVDTFRKFKRGF